MVNNKGNIGWRLCLPIFPYFFLFFSNTIYSISFIHFICIL
nr:MAG TPA: hypothetical protein [Caudoviricetes sp.]